MSACIFGHVNMPFEPILSRHRDVMISTADNYKGFTDLATAQVEGTDYRVHVRAKARSTAAVTAPHGGQHRTVHIGRCRGGRDAQTLADLLLRQPAKSKSQTQSVTREPPL